MKDYEMFIKLLQKAGAEFEEFELSGQLVIRVYNRDGDNVDFTFSPMLHELYMVD